MGELPKKHGNNKHFFSKLCWFHIKSVTLHRFFEHIYTEFEKIQYFSCDGELRHKHYLFNLI